MTTPAAKNFKRTLVTSALPYANGEIHLGHLAGAYLPADTYVRYLRARGHEVRFICGSDDNGVASLISARKEGRDVRELTAHYNARQAEDFRVPGLGVIQPMNSRSCGSASTQTWLWRRPR